jgi:hypothetical protein
MTTSRWMPLALLAGLLAAPLSAQDAITVPKALASGPAGPHHALLKRLAGQWSQHYRLELVPAGVESEGEAAAENRLILEGRFLQMAFRGLDLDEPGESLVYLGWDDGRGAYVTYGVDEDGKLSVGAEGTWDDSTGTLTLRSVTAPEEDEAPTHVIRLRVLDDRHYVVETWLVRPDQQEERIAIVDSARR